MMNHYYFTCFNKKIHTGEYWSIRLNMSSDDDAKLSIIDKRNNIMRKVTIIKLQEKILYSSSFEAAVQ